LLNVKHRIYGVAYNIDNVPSEDIISTSTIKNELLKLGHPMNHMYTHKKHLKHKKLFAKMLCILLVCGGLSSAQHAYPGQSWEKIRRPEDFGYSLEKLEAVKEFANNKLKTAAVVIVIDGKILFEWGEIEKEFSVHSARKSFMSTLYGNYVKNSTIDLSKTMKALGIDDIPPLTEQEKTANVRQCLKARSGIYHDAAAESWSMRLLKPERDTYRPGEYWCYNNWDFNVLCTIFEQETGRRFYEALVSDIAKPIQMEDFDYDDERLEYEDVSVHPAYHFIMSARDMARFGLLMLRNGYWKGEQVIPEEWVEQITSYHSNASLYGTDGYGYMWWVVKEDNKFPHFPFVKLKDGAYSARGAYGQYLIVLPEYDMVVVHRVNSFEEGNLVSDNAMGLLLKMILDAGPHRSAALPAVSVKTLDKYVGEYEIRPSVSVTISREGNSLYVLYLLRSEQIREELIAETENEFYALNGTIKIKFVENNAGIVDQVIVYQVNRELPAKRIN